jgi:glycosyltransferase involved in cell wall biosynthesis
MPDSGKPKLSVYMITYNHEKYIAQAIEGVLDQKTNFKIKLFIGDDCSVDKTRDICLRYEKQSPDIIEVICTKENDIKVNSENVINACIDSGADYIALCEGDDYWIDPYKLQKQVDFLDENPGFSMCFSAVRTISEQKGLNAPPVLWPEIIKDVITIEDIISSHRHLIPTPTLVFRNIIPKEKPEFYLDALSGDIALAIMLATHGNAKHLPIETAAYRNHGGGITKTEKHIMEGEEALKKLYLGANKYYGYKYNSIFRKRLLEMSKNTLIYGAKHKKGIEKIKHYFKSMPVYIKYSDRINFKELAYYHAILFFPSLLRLFKKPAETRSE